MDQYRQTGDLTILVDLYQAYIPLVFGLCLKYFKDSHQAEDAVMDIFNHLCVKLKDHDVTHFKSWLYMVTKNHCLGTLRKNNSDKVKEKEAYRMYSEQIFHPDEVEDIAIKEKLKDCLNKLNHEQSECIRLFYLQEKTYQEVSDETGYNWSAVRSYIQNGRRNLKKCLES